MFTTNDILSLTHLEAHRVDALKRLKIKGVSTDSRTAGPDDLFIALRGETFDGHEFIPQVADKGVRVIIADAEWKKKHGIPDDGAAYVIVKDTVEALGALARMVRRRHSIPVLAVGGSNGKTTTKEMIAAVLARTHAILKTEGNLNNHIGVPQTLFRLQKKHRIAVVEIGTNHPGEIEYLCGILEPTEGIITNVGKEHLEFFGSVEGVAKAEAELTAWLSSKRGSRARFFVNADDQLVAKPAARIKRRIAYGMASKRCDVRGRVEDFDERGCALLRVEPQGKRAFTARLTVPGAHNAMNALAAAAVGLAHGVPAKEIVKALETFTAASKRSQVMSIGGITVINDAYNSNPDSARAALQTLAALRTNGKRVAVLGDMLELGASSEREHAAVGAFAAEAGVDALFTFGPLSRRTHEAADVKRKLHFESKSELADVLVRVLASGDAVLVKGSRGMKMEDVIESLKQHYPVQ